MPELIYIEKNGTSHHVEAALGQTVMHVALRNMVPGILGDCGGVCSCATCHVYIDNNWQGILPSMSETESFLLEGVPDANEGSRLSCQLKVSEAMAGMIIRLPEEQY